MFDVVPKLDLMEGSSLGLDWTFTEKRFNDHIEKS